jgi:hypothetical protein
MQFEILVCKKATRKKRFSKIKLLQNLQIPEFFEVMFTLFALVNILYLGMLSTSDWWALRPAQRPIPVVEALETT